MGPPTGDTALHGRRRTQLRLLAGWAGLLIGLAGLTGWACATGAAEPAADAASAESEAVSPPGGPTHRSMRQPLPPMDALPKPSVPQAFTGYPGAPPYTVVSRKPELPLFPCSMCHNLQPLNTTVRTFKVAPPPDGAPHAGVLDHGKGQFWCLACHYAKDREWLRTLDDQKVDVDDSARVCGQCHSARHRDWTFGAHGKRVAGWNGEREIYTCTHCHDPHAPRILPREASPPPPVRAGLQPMQVTRHPTMLPWQQPAQGQAHAPKTQP